MYNIAKLSNNDRDIVFKKYSFEYSISEAIVEKDFWVTLILDYLFHKCKYKDVFIRIINKHKHPPVYPYWVSFGFRISVDSDWYDYTSNVILIID
jgi:hypothetical protein